MICARNGCSESFEPKTHNQKYCCDECCRIATTEKIKEKYRAKKERLSGKVRVCSVRGCNTHLSRYREESVCESCQNKKTVSERKNLLEMIKNVSG